MKFKYISFIFFSITLLFSACTEIIDIGINSSDPQIVVEASIALNEKAQVMLTKSIDLDDENSYPGIEGATVIMTDNWGNTEQLRSTGVAGYYVSRELRGEKGTTYNIDITYNDDVITASSSIPSLVLIDSMKVVRSIYPGGGPPISSTQEANFYEFSVYYTDPINVNNYYRYLIYVNGLALSGNRISVDSFNDGNQIENKLIIYSPLVESGDTLTVEMQCIEKPVYEYFKSMSSSGGPSSGSPANPYSNLTGTLLGYFSAHTVQRREFIVE